MKFLEPMWIAICTYSVLPAPIFDWNKENMRYSLCFFPVVGVVIGIAMYLWYLLACALNASGVIFAAIAAIIPILITGGIHMDGYMDTVDALSSHQSRERKLEILKDSHCGAFAVIYCCVYFVAVVGFLWELYSRGVVPAICIGYVISRACSGWCAVTMKNARGSGMLAAFTEPAEGKKAKIALLGVGILAMAAECALFFPVGIGTGAFAILTVIWYRRKTMKEFGGVTGDTSGFFLQVCELMMLLGTWIGSYL